MRVIRRHVGQDFHPVNPVGHRAVGQQVPNDVRTRAFAPRNDDDGRRRGTGPPPYSNGLSYAFST
jgi:hypothetical protein